MSDREYTTQEIIDEMLDLGWSYTSGEHTNGNGFYFAFIKPGSRNQFSSHWHHAGHGFTKRESVEEALAIAVGVGYAKRASEFGL